MIEPHEQKFQNGEWYCRLIGTRFWLPCEHRLPREQMTLRYKRGRFFVHRYDGFEYSYRFFKPTVRYYFLGGYKLARGHSVKQGFREGFSQEWLRDFPRIPH